MCEIRECNKLNTIICHKIDYASFQKYQKRKEKEKPPVLQCIPSLNPFASLHSNRGRASADDN
jgi:hypothetical protein